MIGCACRERGRSTSRHFIASFLYLIHFHLPWLAGRKYSKSLMLKRHILWSYHDIFFVIFCLHINFINKNFQKIFLLKLFEYLQAYWVKLDLNTKKKCLILKANHFLLIVSKKKKLCYRLFFAKCMNNFKYEFVIKLMQITKISSSKILFSSKYWRHLLPNDAKWR